MTDVAAEFRIATALEGIWRELSEIRKVLTPPADTAEVAETKASLLAQLNRG